MAPARTALAILCGGQVDPALVGTIAKCVNELPPGARWLSLGVMLGRPAGVDGYTDLVTLALDVGTSVHPRLGIEYNLEARRSPW
ncbi:MAG TPA: hypothetical protein VFV67_11335 [Actinophytocola sp.]|uniref:hypothetical protein n=1 Tax=Actinophytocola sp. TaxID=1872138 RepID=UPI002DB5A3F0|nr:hypothetical protein [Actinophytocola sp.]HEU5471237.1 hypothetical protein [Actinophytocola sp.]